MNRFNVLYKKFFRVSPINGLIAIRPEKAKALLMEEVTAWARSRIAAVCRPLQFQPHF